MNIFYSPDIADDKLILKPEESKHIIRVLRMQTGDIIHLTDGKGYFYDCEISDPNPRACSLSIIKKWKGDDRKDFYLHIAIAPTKNINRFEWFLEKSTEIGIDQITPIICEHSERKAVKPERLKKVLISAMKQSLKSQLPVLEPIANFSTFINQDFNGQKFIAFIDDGVNTELSKIYHPHKNALILIGPEGGFSKDEVELAEAKSFIPVRLGRSRLRTETAGIMSCSTINILNQ